jgi:two-component system response regulator HydG
VYAAIERAGGNKTLAAKLLGITRRRLYSLLASFGDRGA